jgi:hypothetical protein
MLSHAGSAIYLVVSVASRRIASMPLPMTALGAKQSFTLLLPIGGSCPRCGP